MLQGILSASSLAFFLATSSGCGLLPKWEPEGETGPVSKVFKVKYDKAWDATQKVLAKYPIEVNNIDLGLLKTDTIKAYSVWRPPNAKELSGGYRYKLTVRLIKGKHNSTKVTVSKEITLKKDFFANEKTLPTDGLEEKVILYRIHRELKIKRAIDKLQSKSNS